VFIGEILANMTQVSDVAPGPLVFVGIVFCFCIVINCATASNDRNGAFFINVGLLAKYGLWQEIFDNENLANLINFSPHLIKVGLHCASILY
jgi:hypothetical protein